jgi:hypothetical protein
MLEISRGSVINNVGCEGDKKQGNQGPLHNPLGKYVTEIREGNALDVHDYFTWSRGVKAGTPDESGNCFKLQLPAEEDPYAPWPILSAARLLS